MNNKEKLKTMEKLETYFTNGKYLTKGRYEHIKKKAVKELNGGVKDGIKLS